MLTSHIVTGFSLLLALAAAIAWGASAAVNVPSPPRVAELELTGDINQVVHALQTAARYNRLAAGLTALATLAQMFGAYLSGP